MINKNIKIFEEFCRKRHIEGEAKYGKWTPKTKKLLDWLYNSLEEKSDDYNYLGYAYKLTHDSEIRRIMMEGKFLAADLVQKINEIKLEETKWKNGKP